MGQNLSLTEYAAAKAKPPCPFCALPERDECDEAYRNGIHRRVILEWLREVRGYQSAGVSGVSDHAADKHYQGKHHHKEL